MLSCDMQDSELCQEILLQSGIKHPLRLSPGGREATKKVAKQTMGSGDADVSTEAGASKSSAFKQEKSVSSLLQKVRFKCRKERID